MESSTKIHKPASNSPVNTSLKSTLSSPKLPSYKFIYYIRSINGRSKTELANSRVKLKHFRTFLVSKSTPFDRSHMQKTRKWFMHGSFTSILKRFRNVKISNDFILQILTLMPKVNFLRNLTVYASSPKVNKRLDNFDFQAGVLKKYFKLKRLEKYCCSGDFQITKTVQFTKLTRILTRLRNLTVFNFNLSVESLLSFSQHKEILTYVPPRFKRLPHFSHFHIPNLTDVKIKENTSRFYSTLLANCHVTSMRASFDRNNYKSQLVLLQLIVKSPKLKALDLDLKINSEYSDLVLAQVVASLSHSSSILCLAISIHASYGVTLRTFLKGLPLHSHFKEA